MMDVYSGATKRSRTSLTEAESYYVLIMPLIIYLGLIPLI